MPGSFRFQFRVNFFDPHGQWILPDDIDVGSTSRFQPGWSIDTRHRDPNGYNLKHDSGGRASFHIGRPDEFPATDSRSFDHWHLVYPDGREINHLVPGEEVPDFPLACEPETERNMSTDISDPNEYGFSPPFEMPSLQSHDEGYEAWDDDDDLGYDGPVIIFPIMPGVSEMIEMLLPTRSPVPTDRTGPQRIPNQPMFPAAGGYSVSG